MVLAAGASAACVKDEAPKRREVASSVAIWELPPELAGAEFRLFPPDKGAPVPGKRRLTTETEHGELRATVEGNDPYLVWRFETFAHAAVVRIDVEASQTGPLQLFWATARCPVFSEPCSATTIVPSGASIVSFLLDAAEPLRELRLDLPNQRGATCSFRSIALRTTGDLDAPWLAKGDQVELALTPNGLSLHARTNDPWMTVATPGLEAAWVGSIELVLRGPAGGEPQLYWEGACGGFSEVCSARLVPADAGALTHRASLSENPSWHGRIDRLRLDPGANAGEYLVEHLGLMRPGAATPQNAEGRR